MSDTYILTLANDEMLNIHKKYKEDFGSITLLGGFRTLRTKERLKTLDIIDRLNLLSKGAISLFTELKLNLDYINNLSYYPIDTFTNSQKVTFRRCMAELKKVDLVKKAKTISRLEPIKKGTYMINPQVVKCNEYAIAVKTWDLLK